jgi:hypothetical protein
VKLFTASEAVLFEVIQILLWIALIFVLTSTVRALATTFHTRQRYYHAFMAIAYGLSPLFLLKLADGIPTLSVWVPWLAGAGLCLSVLYYGIPLCLQPDPAHAFGLYLMSSITVVIATGVLRFLTAWFLKGEFESLESAFSSLAQRLPF